MKMTVFVFSENQHRRFWLDQSSPISIRVPPTPKLKRLGIVKYDRETGYKYVSATDSFLRKEMF